MRTRSGLRRRRRRGAAPPAATDQEIDWNGKETGRNRDDSVFECRRNTGSDVENHEKLDGMIPGGH